MHWSLDAELWCKGRTQITLHSFLQDLVDQVEAVIQLQQQVTWLGGISNHEDIFQPLYRMLLALHTAASRHAPNVQEALQQASSCLDQLELNPVLSALLHATLAKWSGTAAADLEKVRQLSASFPHLVATPQPLQHSACAVWGP